MRVIHNRFKIFLYGMAGLGMNMLNLIVGSYLCDALMVEGFKEDIANWTYVNRTLVVAAVWSIMISFAKVLDGIIDIPFASWTDNLKSRFGRRRPAILIGLVLTVASYAAFLNPPSLAGASLRNTIYASMILCLFYSFYTLTMVTYYATFSEIVDNDSDRLFLSNVKTVFDVVYFVFGYALIPMMIGSMNIRLIGWIFLPLSLTMLIPLFMIKEDSTLTTDQDKKSENSCHESPKTTSMLNSIMLTLKSKGFLMWMLVYAILQFGLQLYLTGQNVLYSGVMEFEGMKITIVMACVFAPVPLTLILYNKVIKKFGIQIGYAYSVILYCVAMLLLFFCKASIIPNDTTRLVVACIGAAFASFGMGCFFSINYTIPATIAVNERDKTGVSNPAMYFAIQGVTSGIATAIATGIVWVNLKTINNGNCIYLMPLIVLAACFVSLVISCKLPKKIKDIGKIERKLEN